MQVEHRACDSDQDSAGEAGRARAHRVLKALVMLALLMTLLPGGAARSPQGADAAGSTAVTIVARDRATHAVIPDFRFVINRDNTHVNASLVNPESYTPLAKVGSSASPTVNLGAGKYLVTVLAGPSPPRPSDYKMWGAHFSVNGTGSTTVTVDMVKNPLPASTLRVRVFHDNNSVGGEDDIPLEDGLAGFHVTLYDPTGEVVVDNSGDPLCGGQCLSNSDGIAVIPNLGPGKYAVEVIPPNGSGWIQTSTIEGKHENDAWLPEGSTGFSTEEGFVQAAVWFGFVRQCQFGSTGDDCPTNDTAGSGSITGRVRQTADVEAPGAVDLGVAINRPYVALNNTGGNDEQVYTGRGNANGTFTIPDVPAGTYQLVYWDGPLDYIIQFQTVTVEAGQVTSLGDIGMPRWFGTIKGYAYTDNGKAVDGTVFPGGSGNGIRDCHEVGGAIDPNNVQSCEKGLAGQDFDFRHKDGTVQYATVADSKGYYEFPEYFEWEHWLLWEVGYGRLHQTGTTGYLTSFTTGMPNRYPYQPEINPPSTGLGSLLQANMTLGGYTNWYDSGKLPHAAGQNGGITGIVYYATTRNEFDPRFALAEDYEPGIPGVRVNLYSSVLDANGDPVREANGAYRKGQILNTYITDSWYDARPTDCQVPEHLGQPAFNDPNCTELPRTLNQIKEGVFDGGYAFEETCGATLADPDGDDDGDGVPNRLDRDLLSDSCDALANADYIVEVEPTAGYRVITEADQNTDQGDDFVPAIPDPPCAGRKHLVSDPRNPADGTRQPYCDNRFVTVDSGVNPAANFFLMTNNAVPPAGRLRGLLLDDLQIEVNTKSPLYGEKRGIPNAPIGILDFAGNEITRVYSDKNGYWEVLLPSTYTAKCPIPSGICPGMYQVVGNYPGSPTNPDSRWNPNYGTLNLAFDLWPGRTTYADVAILPITTSVEGINPGFNNPAQCKIPATTPDLRSVDQPYGSAGGQVTVNGLGFGSAQGNGAVTLGDTELPISSWSDTQITADIPAGTAAAPYQLLVRRDGGTRSPTGITFHVLGAGYNPPLRHVGSGQTYAKVQDAIQAAAAGDLILVHPGTYYESVILHKKVQLQGYGPGATSIDGRFFGFGGTTPEEFQDLVSSITFDGPASVPMGQTITVLAADGEFTAADPARIDGIAVRGGTRGRGRVVNVQGGGIYLHAYARNLVVSNDLVQSNAGNLGGGVILGAPYTTNPDAGNALDLQNDGLHMHHSRIVNNGGVSLAGGVALFNGSAGYEIDHNVICGNYSAEYGAGISHYGRSPGGSIHDNKIAYNSAFDEGGGIMVAGEQPTNQPLAVSLGSGSVSIERNVIQFNLSNDDGGGIRLLQPADSPVRIVNNIVANNVATDLGGGISLDDALDVHIIDNTIVRNVSTATAEDADRSTCSPVAFASCAHAAGISSEPHSQALMDAFSPPKPFSDPLMFGNILWHNQAFHLTGNAASPLVSSGFIDLEVVGITGCMSPSFSMLSSTQPGCPAGTGNMVGVNPRLVAEVSTRFDAVAFAGDVSFVTILIKSSESTPQGNYHIGPTSPAINSGSGNVDGVDGPADDIDGDPRPNGPNPDIGADERGA